MYRRRDSHKPPDALIKRFKDEFSDVMPLSDQGPSNPSRQGHQENADSMAEFSNFSQFAGHVPVSGSQGFPQFAFSGAELNSDWDGTFANPDDMDLHPYLGFQSHDDGHSGASAFAQSDFHEPSGHAGHGDTTVSAPPSAFMMQPSHHIPMGLHGDLQPRGQHQGFDGFQHPLAGYSPRAFGGQAPHQVLPSNTFDAGLGQSTNPTRAGSSQPHPKQHVRQSASWPLAPEAEGAAAQPSIEDDFPGFPESDDFRFRTILKATTAMVTDKNPEIVSYLNRNHVYEVTVTDTRGDIFPSYAQPRYRTAVRLTHHPENMRRDPFSFWSMWYRGRGKADAKERGVIVPRAFAFVAAESTSDNANCAKVECVEEKIDGFTVEWSPLPGKPAQCSINMQFYVLASDFTVAKGVRAQSIRLVAKTELLSSPAGLVDPSMEMTYCLIRTFRDHGADRKLNNDMLHVNKNIKKMSDIEPETASKQRKRRSSTGGGRSAKRARRRSGSDVTQGSQSEELPHESQDPQIRLQAFKEMQNTKKKEARFRFVADPSDDPDITIVLKDSEAPERGHDHFKYLYPQDKPDPTQSSPFLGGAPAVSSGPTSGGTVEGLPYPTPPRLASQSSGETRPLGKQTLSHSESSFDVTKQFASPTVSVTRTLHSGGSGAPQIEVSDCDPAYVAPPTPKDRPVCCLFVKPTICGRRVGDDKYRALYLKERTLDNFLLLLTSKCGIDMSAVVQVTRVNASGVESLVEDDMIQAVAEEQDLLAEFEQLDLTHATAEDFKNEEDGGATPTINYSLTLRY